MISRQQIQNIINGIEPFDKLEAEHKADVLAWVDSDSQLFRISKPDNPPKHLVSYFLPFDEQKSSVMLIDHVKSGLWLSPGGHVEIDENPYDTVVRESHEELKVEPDFNTPFGNKPFFLTVNITTGQNEHTDVSLWYIVKGNTTTKLDSNSDEINSCKWLTFDESSTADITKLDRHMHRCIAKMKSYLAAR